MQLVCVTDIGASGFHHWSSACVESAAFYSNTSHHTATSQIFSIWKTRHISSSTLWNAKTMPIVLPSDLQTSQPSNDNWFYTQTMAMHLMSLLMEMLSLFTRMLSLFMRMLSFLGKLLSLFMEMLSLFMRLLSLLGKMLSFFMEMQSLFGQMLSL